MTYNACSICLKFVESLAGYFKTVHQNTKKGIVKLNREIAEPSNVSVLILQHLQDLRVFVVFLWPCSPTRIYVVCCIYHICTYCMFRVISADIDGDYILAQF